MDPKSNLEHVFQKYDYLFIIASWGSPREYKPSKYAMEVEEIEDFEDSGVGRNVIKDNAEYHSSTAAMKNLLQGKNGMYRDRVKVLIFCQDTIFMDCDRLKDEFEKYNGREIKRCKLIEKLFEKLYRKNPSVAEELGVKDYSDYKKFVRFVPGVMTRVEGSYLYTWGGDYCYDLLLGGIILYTYKELRSMARNAERIAILLDTTHGINYFVTALKEGVVRAATIYAFDRLVEDFNNSSEEHLKELVIYHYNSDPLSSEPEGTPSLRIHLLDKIIIVEDGQVLLNSIFNLVEDYNQKKVISQLNEFWKNEDIDWSKIHGALLLFSRGVLTWALRVAVDISGIPEVNELENSLSNDLGLSFSRNGGLEGVQKYNATYRRTDKYSTAQVCEYSLLTHILKNMTIKIRCDDDIRDRGFKILEEASKQLYDELSKINLSNKIQYILIYRDAYTCFNLEKLRKVVEQVYSPPYRNIVINEVKNLEAFLAKNKKIKWISKSKHIYKAPRDPAYIIVYNDIRILISVGGNASYNINDRIFYAHGGLAYGLPWFALPVNKDSDAHINLYLGGHEPVLHFLKLKGGIKG